MVKVLPDPVTPSSTWSPSLPRTPLTSSSIACGWSPFGSNSDTTRKRRPPSDLSGRGGRWRSHGGRLRMLGSPSSKRALSESAVTAAPVRPRGWLSGKAPSNLGCGASPNPCGLGSTKAGLSSSARCSPSGWTSGREALDLDLDLGPGADFRGAGIERNMGRIGGQEKGDHRGMSLSLDRGWSFACSCQQLTVGHPGERSFDGLLISPAILSIKKPAADSKEPPGRGTLPSLPDHKGTGNNGSHPLPPRSSSDGGRRRRRRARFGAHIDAHFGLSGQYGARLVRARSRAGVLAGGDAEQGRSPRAGHPSHRTCNGRGSGGNRFCEHARSRRQLREL